MQRLALVLAFLPFAVVLIAAARATPRTPEPARSAIHAAAVTFRVSERSMVSVARCETGGDFDPRSYNRASGAAGLFQFLPGTWHGTPYRTLSRFDAYANSLAAAWLVRRDGGWGEWACRP